MSHRPLPDPLPEEALEALFAQAPVAAPPQLSAEFAARLLAQAEAARPRPAPPPGLWARLRAALAALGAELGGAPGLAGLGAAGVAGLWLGLAQPLDAASVIWAGAVGVSPSLSGLLETATAFDEVFDILP